jgi:hypothetical protein
MSVLRRFLAAVVSFALLVTSPAAFQPQQQNEFRPLSEIPASEQLPGGTFVVIAYGFVWIAAMIYIWTIWRRLGKVEEEMRSLQRRSRSEPR